MAILVTGGAGYIGSHTAAALLDAGRKVVVLDNLSTGVRERVPAEALFVQGDVGNVQLVYQLLTKHAVDSVLHFAAFVDVEESVQKPEKYYANNLEHTRKLAHAAYVGGVKHFIFSSTAAVYGNPTQVPVAEGAPLAPVSPYGDSKMQAEDAVRKEAQQGDMRFSILRYFNVAGCDRKGRYGYTIGKPTHLIRRGLAVALGRAEYLPIFGTDYSTPDGTAVRDYIDVTDLAQAHIGALTHLEHGGKSDTYNVGYGRGYSVFNVHSALQRVTGKKIPMRCETRRPGDPASIIADSAKIRTELGWVPAHDDLDDMIESQYRWELSQQKDAA